MMTYVKEVYRYAGVPVDFEEIRFDPNSESETDFFDAITSIKRNGVAIKGKNFFIFS
jgi:isocitrate dehydrogenase (NAD+)